MRTGRRAAVLASQRGDVDDASFALTREMLAENLAAKQHAAQVDVDDLIELLSGNLHDGYDFRRARIVDERIDTAPARDDRIALEE